MSTQPRNIGGHYTTNDAKPGNHPFPYVGEVTKSTKFVRMKLNFDGTNMRNENNTLSKFGIQDQDQIYLFLDDVGC